MREKVIADLGKKHDLRNPAPTHLTRRQFLLGALPPWQACSSRRGFYLGQRYLPLPARIRRAYGGSKGPLIVDHTAVDQCQNIPQAYIDLVKSMWLNVPGESHSEAYRTGC